MTGIYRRTTQACLIIGALALTACGGGGGGSTNTNVNDVGVRTAPSNSDLQNLLAQGPINDEAIDLSDTAQRQVDNTQDAFDLADKP